MTATTYRRPSRTVTGVLAGFLAGLLVAVIAVPDHEESEPPGVAALGAAGESLAGADGDATAPGVGALTGPVAAGAAPGVARPAAGRAGATAATPSGGTVAGSTAPVDNTKLPNGGATARGVTATEIKVGVSSIDPAILTPICPTCDPGQAKEGKPAEALVAAWTRDGLLPVNGRTIKPINRIVGLTADQQRSACAYFAQEQKPFLVVTGAGTSGTGACLAGEHKMAVVDPWGGYKDATLQQNYPLIHTAAPSASRILRNFVYWAEDNGLLKGRTIGMFSSEDSSVNASSAFGVDPYLDQPSLTRYFREVLTQKGYRLAVDYVAGPGQEAAAVARFRGAGVDVAFLFAGVPDFQQQARQQNYHPKYPLADLGYTLGDARATSDLEPEEMHGQLAMGVRTWPKNWVQRKPATPPPEDKAAAYCMKAYADYTKQTLDTIDNSSEISLTLDICTGMEVARAALAAAGPNLTVERFIGGLQTIKNMQTSEYASVSFAPGRYSGSDNYASAQYNKDRWQPGNELFRYVTPWRPMWVP